MIPGRFLYRNSYRKRSIKFADVRNTGVEHGPRGDRNVCGKTLFAVGWFGPYGDMSPHVQRLKVTL